ncbi:sigma 54-interacting transcriptional regulator [Pendulispora albinea]|uniref:Sigma 54-interacting transcriptional regulator n=1 Tax=Pendulispora albinea TaxID=2741071 RepID=A0ABZ2M3Q5_9BACT
MVALPPRYEAKHPLGKGGGGEVWAVRDRVTGRMLALKALATGAGVDERLALVREAMALSGLQGLGVPRVMAFGALPENGRRYMVRELVPGESLEDAIETRDPRELLLAIAHASQKLTVIHRAGLLHGDIKPANIIVDPAGKATWVDLGLSVSWRARAGTQAEGLTPHFAAPELFRGEPLTVRAEVYSLGATMAEVLKRARAPWDLDREALGAIAARAMAEDPDARYPSVDELASALRHAARLAPSQFGEGNGASGNDDESWPVVGIEGVAQSLSQEVAALLPGDALAIAGSRGSGRTTLALRLAWTLGIEGRTVARIDPPRGGLSLAEVVELELGAVPESEMASAVVIVDDVALLNSEARAALLRASRQGARMVGVGALDDVALLCDGETRLFEVPHLEPRAAEELVLRAMPSLPKALVSHLIGKAHRAPGPLRAAIRALAGRPIVSADEIDAMLHHERRAPAAPPPSLARGDRFARGERFLDTGRIDEAEKELGQLGEGRDAGERVRLAVAYARASLGRGDPAGAAAKLDLVHGELPDPEDGDLARAWKVARARAHLRLGAYPAAAELAAEAVTAGADDDALSADALCVHGIALAFTGDDAAGREALARALDVARDIGDRRLEAVALGAVAIVHQRAGQNAKARESYEQSLAAAEAARDAGTVALTRLNLAGLARAEGDLALALTHLEAAVDMGRRAGGLLAVRGALLHLANLDSYLGRYARARASIDSLAEERASLSPIHLATLLGLEAELAARTGDVPRASALYEESARAWDATGSHRDAAESRLEGLLARADAPGADTAELALHLDKVRAGLGESGFGEHEALAGIVAGTIALLSGEEGSARQALDRAHEQAAQAGRREWQWRSLEARARLSAAQGNKALARRDIESALAILEETAAKLPRDLREVFWNDPRRRALQQAHGSTTAVPSTRIAELQVRLPAMVEPPAHAAGAMEVQESTTTSQATPRTTSWIGRPLLAEDRLVRILEITRELASIHDIGRLLAKVTDHAMALLGAERGFVVLANEHGELTTHTSRDRKGDDPHAQFSHSVAEKVVQTGEPVIAISARDDARLAQAVSVHQLMIQSIACVPIAALQMGQAGQNGGELAPETPGGARAEAPRKTIGALYLETRLRPGARFNDELPTLAAFADQAAIAIANTRLIAENRQRAEELARTNRELEEAHAKVSELLGRRTEQLELTRRNLKEVRAQIRSHFGYAGLVGTSAAMRKVYAVIERIKDTDVPVLVTGESGTGKEVVAKAIHASGARAKRTFIGVNCGAIPANLLESELFGHVRGAFTGADRDRKGLFREAEHGTILLDEIGDIPFKMQAGLLRVLQERSVRPVGGEKEEPCDVRVIAATNRDLAQMVTDGTFREDLYYRLHVVEVRIPPLRERIDDILPLIDHFLSLFAARHRRERKSVGREALRRLSAYDWPGNVRQLEHVLLNAWLMSDAKELQLEDFELPDPSSVARTSTVPTSASQPRLVARTKAEFKDTERQRILDALAECNWNRVQAARLVGVPRRTFYRRLKEFGII